MEIPVKKFRSLPIPGKDRFNEKTERKILPQLFSPRTEETGASADPRRLAARARRLANMISKEVVTRNAEIRLSQWLDIKRRRAEARDKARASDMRGETEGVESIGHIYDVTEKSEVPATTHADAQEKMESCARLSPRFVAAEKVP